MTLFLNTNDLFAYLKKFLSTNPDAVQLDGSTERRSNQNAQVYFFYKAIFYGINGDSKRDIIESLVEGGFARDPFYEDETGTRKALRLKGHEKPDGWYCYEASEAISLKLIMEMGSSTKKKVA